MYARHVHAMYTPCMHHVFRKDPESEWLTGEKLGTNPITIKPKTASHVAEQSSRVPWPSCSPPGCPFLVKSVALSAHMSPRKIHFWVLDRSPLLSPERGAPSWNIIREIQRCRVRPNKPKCWCLEQRKISGECVVPAQRSQTLRRFSWRNFYRQNLGCGMQVEWLSSDWLVVR